MSIAIAYLIYLIIGAAAGILGGLLGIGGGIITVPALFLMFHFMDFPQPYIMHMAIATSLAAMIFNTAAATWAHNKRGAVLWPVFKKMVPGFVAGSILGALIAVWFSGVLLQIVFGLFLCALAFFFYRQKAIEIGSQKLPSSGKLNCYSCGIGIVSNLLGIGGGILVVPLLSSFKISDKNAIGTSAASTLVTTILGTLSYLILGWGDIPALETIGLIDLPAFIVIGAAAFFFAPVGVRLSHEMARERVRKIFAVVLALTGVSLIFM